MSALIIPIILWATIIPTAVYALAFYWADRHEREPVWLIVVAFLWGAIPAIVTSLIAESILSPPLFGPPDALAQTVYENVFVAPLVEETAKGLALYALYRFVRREFDGVVDGITYGALIGFGFAMTENAFYFFSAFLQGGALQLSVVYFLRTVIFGLNHALYTGIFGIGLGLARQSQSDSAARAWAILGFGGAVLVHALHNLGASLSAANGLWLLFSFVLAMTAIGFVGLVHLLAIRQEREWIRRELADEVGVLLSSAEYALLTGDGPRKSRVPHTDPGQRKRLKLCVELALRKHRMRRLGARRDRTLPKQIERLRADILALAAEQTISRG